MTYILHKEEQRKDRMLNWLGAKSGKSRRESNVSRRSAKLEEQQFWKEQAEEDSELRRVSVLFSPQSQGGADRLNDERSQRMRGVGAGFSACVSVSAQQRYGGQ